MRIKWRAHAGFFEFDTSYQIPTEWCDHCGLDLKSGYSVIRKRLAKFIDAPKLCCFCWLYDNADSFSVEWKYGNEFFILVDGIEYHYDGPYAKDWLHHRGFLDKIKQHEMVEL